jgi:hypothetical protein
MRFISKQSSTFIAPYRVQSPVSPPILRELISALDGNAINITDTNYTELQQLSTEFGFSGISAKLSEFRSSMDLKETETEAEPETEAEAGPSQFLVSTEALCDSDLALSQKKTIYRSVQCGHHNTNPQIRKGAFQTRWCAS